MNDTHVLETHIIESFIAHYLERVAELGISFATSFVRSKPLLMFAAVGTVLQVGRILP